MLARHLPLVAGAPGSRFGGTVHGIELAARTLWGKPAAALDLAEQAVLAAAARRPILLAAGTGDPGGAAAAARWELLRARAAHGLALAYGTDDPRVALARARLAELPRPVTAQWVRWPEAAPSRPVPAHPERRALALLGPVLPLLVEELDGAVGPGWHGRLRGVRITLDIETQLRLASALGRRLAQLRRELGPRLALPLDAQPRRPAFAQLLAVRVDARGRIRALFTNGEAPLLAARARPRQIGSLGKAVLALALGARDEPAARWCNLARADGAVHNPGGNGGVPSCAAPGAWHDARRVFARSENLPLLWRAERLPEAELRALARAAGLGMPADTPAASALTLGLAEAPPRRILALFQALGSGVLGRPATAPDPALIEHLDLGSGPAPASAAVPLVDLGTVLASREVRRFVAAMLRAPLDPDGTLARLGRAAAAGRVVLAKTGTTTTPGGGIRDKWAAGAVAESDGAGAWLVLLGSSEPRHPLGHGIGGNSLAPVVELLLDGTPDEPGPATDNPASWPTTIWRRT
jgi:membrane peptidoglycan carboxypeptidase